MKAFEEILRNSIALHQQILQDADMLHELEQISVRIVACLKNDGKVLFCGNGGSAADAQHLAAELSGRFYMDRPPLFAEALHTNSSYMTAVANDYGYDQVFSRQVQAKGREGDFLIGLSTSGNSSNVLKAFAVAKEKKMICLSFTGETGGKMKALSDYCLRIPSDDTPRIQECHILLGHMLCERIESLYFQEENA